MGLYFSKNYTDNRTLAEQRQNKAYDGPSEIKRSDYYIPQQGTNCSNNDNNYAANTLSQIFGRMLNSIENYTPTVDGTPTKVSGLEEQNQNTSEIEEGEGLEQNISKEKPEDVITNALKKVDNTFDWNTQSDKFKQDILAKYEDMSKQNLSPEVLNLRLQNYARGWRFHDFEARAERGEDVSVNYVRVGETVEERKSNLANHYTKLADSYNEFYDTDGNGQINIYEMFEQYMTDYYSQEKGMSRADAATKAKEVAEDFKNQKSSLTGIIPAKYVASSERDMFEMIEHMFTTLESEENPTAETIDNLSKSDILRYIAAKSQYKDTDATVTANESVDFDKGLLIEDFATVNHLEKAGAFIKYLGL